MNISQSDQFRASGRLPLEYAALGLLIAQPRHGYELYQEFAEQFGSIWSVGRSHFYAALKNLESAGYVETSIQMQDSRPPRKVLAPLPAGRAAFDAWLHSPVPHVRQLRVELLAKLHFFDLLSRDGVSDLIDAQTEVCRRRLERLGSGGTPSKDRAVRFGQLVRDFRRHQTEAVLDWLESCRDTFA